MSTRKTLKGIGKKLREDARDIVDAQLPARLAALLRRLQMVEQQPRQPRGLSGIH